MTAVEERFIGMVEVDSGTLLVGDPCYVLPRAAHDKAGVDYQEVLEADSKEFASRIGGMPVLLFQNFGGDGSFPVFGEFMEGELIGVRINLSPPFDDDDEEGDDNAD